MRNKIAYPALWATRHLPTLKYISSSVLSRAQLTLSRTKHICGILITFHSFCTINTLKSCKQKAPLLSNLSFFLCIFSHGDCFVISNIREKKSKQFSLLPRLFVRCLLSCVRFLIWLGQLTWFKSWWCHFQMFTVNGQIFYSNILPKGGCDKNTCDIVIKAKIY